MTLRTLGENDLFYIGIVASDPEIPEGKALRINLSLVDWLEEKKIPYRIWRWNDSVLVSIKNIIPVYNLFFKRCDYVSTFLHFPGVEGMAYYDRNGIPKRESDLFKGSRYIRKIINLDTEEEINDALDVINNMSSIFYDEGRFLYHSGILHETNPEIAKRLWTMLENYVNCFHPVSAFKILY